MCGICCRICVKSDDTTCGCDQMLGKDDGQARNQWQDQLGSTRGPDLACAACCDIDNQTTQGDSFRFHLQSHVLWTQGVEPRSQPYCNKAQTKRMLFNGDIYSFSGFQEISGFDSRETNDGVELFQRLESCDRPEEFCHVISQLQGPFAFIYIDQSASQVWFARDFFGRESLLFSYGFGEAETRPMWWNISSVSVYNNICEVPALGLFRLSLPSKVLDCFPYSHLRTSVSEAGQQFLTFLKTAEFITSGSISSEIVINTHFLSKLKSPPDDPNNSDSILSSILNEAKLSASPEDFLRRVQVPIFSFMGKFLYYMRQSIRRRVSTLPPYCKNCIKLKLGENPGITCGHPKVGVLFSGGLDSTVIAYLAAEALHSNSTLDLINVAFSKDDNFSNVPDRKTAIASYKMLKERFQCQNKKLNLVLVNVGKDEVDARRKDRIKYLISPLTSVLDDSLGVCLWFAARGEGHLYSEFEPGSSSAYTSPTRITLLGSGADELLGGYGRHRSAYERSGWIGLHSEMQQEIDRISIRNSGRDNRIVSDHGVCPRMPFLDETLVDFLTARVDLWVKCCPVNEGPLGARGSGEKLLLRAVAAHLFGDEHHSLALFPKRAMQFGSRIAKLEESNEKGGDSCERLL